MRKWVAAYGKFGLSGLYTSQRNTRGCYSAIDGDLLAKAKDLREELPSRSIKQVLHLLSTQGLDVSKVSKTTLNDYLNRLGAKKEKVYAQQGAYQRWQKEHINELWQSDCSDGIWLPDPTGLKKIKQTTLVTFIDDASRLCTHGEFYWSENLPSLLDCFSKAVLKYGRCGIIYSDNGSIYRSKHWKSVCAELGMQQQFAEKQQPAGKGKVERHYLTIQRGFYKEAQHSGLQTLEELNEFFAAWLHERYHLEEHQTLKQSPLARWEMEENTIERISVDTLIEALKFREKRRVDFKTALVKLNGTMYQASKTVAGEWIQARWQHVRDAQIEIWKDDIFVEMAHLFKPGSDIDYSKRPQRPRESSIPAILDSSKNYRKQLVARHKQVLPTQTRDEFLSQVEFVDLLQRLLGKSLEEGETAECAQMFQACAPFSSEFVENVVAGCIREKGSHRHIRVYLRRIQDTKQNLR